MTIRPTALLIDFDGVLRRHDPAIAELVELRHGLEPGAILAAGLEWDRRLPAITGEIKRDEWLESIAEALGVDVSVVQEWDAYKGEIVPEVLRFVKDVRAAGMKVGLATNAMDDLGDVLALHGLTKQFDAVANSSEISVHKPAPGFFRAACALVGTHPKQCLFIDDTDRNIRAARAAGLSAYRYTPGDDLSYARKALGI
ncbi:HAD-IA family hydrolase [Dactylosporangium sp. NPDC049742]|uniref:HAD-IA family hydrolase n=1 Tax=Dactylosporangium sp. NPDC049742 TaxID=3154737 RepID=UPI0034493D11